MAGSQRQSSGAHLSMEDLIPFRISLNGFSFLNRGIAKTTFEFLIVIGRTEPSYESILDNCPSDSGGIDDWTHDNVPGCSFPNQVDRKILNLEEVSVPTIQNADH